MSNFYENTANYISKHEGYRDNAYWDTDAYRIGYGSDTITTSKKGDFRKVVKGDVTTRELAGIDLQRRIKQDKEPKVISQIGASAYNKLPDESKTALISLAYNYGSITKPAIIAAAKTGDSTLLAKAIVDSTANDNKRQPAKVQQVLKDRRQDEANLILSATRAIKDVAGKTVKAARQNPIATTVITIALITSAYVLYKVLKKK